MATDDKTFIISVDHRELLKPVDASKAVKFCDGYGPLFGRRSLGVSKAENMNENNNVNCATEGGGGTEFYYMKKDEQGNSKLTGEGSGQPDADKKCTIVALETWVFMY